MVSEVMTFEYRVVSKENSYGKPDMSYLQQLLNHFPQCYSLACWLVRAAG